MKDLRSAGLKHVAHVYSLFSICCWALLLLLYNTGGRSGGIEDLTITISPVRELARSVTEEWPSASGGCPLGLLAGLLPLEIKQR